MNNASYAMGENVNFEKHPGPAILKSFNRSERKLLKVFLMSNLYKLFYDLFRKKIQYDFGKDFDFTMECYAVDGKIIQVLIQEIVETREYTLEGIAGYTRIPLDVIVDVVCGNSSQLSITLWARIVDLYMQVKPEISKYFFDKLAEVKDKNHLSFSVFLHET